MRHLVINGIKFIGTFLLLDYYNATLDHLRFTWVVGRRLTVPF